MTSLGEYGERGIKSALRGQGLTLSIGPVKALVKSPIAHLATDIARVYANYAYESGGVVHHSIVVDHPGLFRRFFRRNVVAFSDHRSPFVPIPERLAFVALEMGMNWQVAMGRNRFIIFHASSIADPQGRGVLMPGGSGSGKSTLAAGLGYSGWRFLGDEFALLCPKDMTLHPFPRPISLKNESIDVMRLMVPDAVFSAPYIGTVKGRITYLSPPKSALDVNLPAIKPHVIVFPRFNKEAGTGQLRPCSPAEAMTRLVGASINYWRHGAVGFETLTRLCQTIAAFHIHSGSMEDGRRLLSQALEEAGP